MLSDRRDDVTLATKAGIPHPDAGSNAPLSAAGLRASVEGSLRRLGTDRGDLPTHRHPVLRTDARATAHRAYTHCRQQPTPSCWR